MRFVVTGEYQRNRLLKLIVALFLIYIAGHTVTNALLYFAHMDLTYRSVVEYYLGSPEQFTEPKTYQGLLEVTHFHLFAMGILLLTLTHLLLFLPMPPFWKGALIGIAFLSAASEEMAGWLIRFVSPSFAYLKIAAFLTLEVALTLLLLIGLVGLFRGQSRAYSSGGSR
ncbi:MAG: hypothetical protein ACOY4L_07920 [Pseudomonadota bacterium]